jgi:ABC-2 type transport system permease protein
VTWSIFHLTLRQLAFRRSSLLLMGLCAIPLLIALVYRIEEPGGIPERFMARGLFLGLIVTAVLPLTALLFGTTAIGDEVEDGTVIYLLTKPVPRWEILAPKLAAAWLLTALFVIPAGVAACFVAVNGVDAGLALALVLSLLVGALAYDSVFALLSIVTSRALIAGLVYVFLWEGAVTSIFTGTRYLSVRHYTLGLADWLAGTHLRYLDAYVGGVTALVLVTLVTIACVLLANRRLEELEVREAT